MVGYKRKFGTTWGPRKQTRRLGGYRGSKGKGKVKGQYQMSSSQRGHLRVGGYYGRFANGGELKFHDIAVDDAVVAATGDIQNGGTINIIPQGVLENNRVGRKCCLKKIMCKYGITLPEQDAVADPAGGDVVRVMIYVDKQCNGATATVANILASASYHSYRALENSGRFVMLCDKTHVINYRTLASDGAGVVSQGQVIQEYTFFKNITVPIEYDNSAATGVLTTIRTNNIGVLLISKNGIAGADMDFRIRFSDS